MKLNPGPLALCREEPAGQAPQSLTRGLALALASVCVVELGATGREKALQMPERGTAAVPGTVPPGLMLG